MSDITTWLEQLGLGRYIQTFIDNDISFLALPELTEEDLMELGLSLGHRRILQRAITNLATDAQRDHVEQAEIEASPAGEAQRRQLTILFCDLVGSTELSRRLDPEELGIIIRAFQERCSAVIMDNKGYVARYMGDGLLAYFGYPVAHEDAVERAIRAGLKVVSGMKELNNSISIDIHPGLAVRVGIATGPVVVGDLIGDGAAQENAVVGETPNLAARLQNVAAPDSVVVASKTRELAGKLFEYEDGEKHALKGMAAPVQV